jgi:hypothetical protein
MRKEEFAEVLGDINENCVKEARNRKKDKISAWGKWGAVAVCLAVVVAVGVFISRQTTDLTQHNQDGTQEVELAGGNDSDDVSADARLQEQIRELQEDDILGWIVIENKIYIQVSTKIDYKESDEDTYLGRASSFTGCYQNEDACDGDVYAVYDNLNIVYIKLDNGGKVTLEEV